MVGKFVHLRISYPPVPFLTCLATHRLRYSTRWKFFEHVIALDCALKSSAPIKGILLEQVTNWIQMPASLTHLEGIIQFPFFLPPSLIFACTSSAQDCPRFECLECHRFMLPLPLKLNNGMLWHRSAGRCRCRRFRECRWLATVGFTPLALHRLGWIGFQSNWCISGMIFV